MITKHVTDKHWYVQQVRLSQFQTMYCFAKRLTTHNVKVPHFVHELI